MKSRLVSLMTALTLAGLLSGCNIVVATRVNADGTGELRHEIIYSAEEVQNFAQAPGNEGKSICDNLNEDPPGGVAEFVEEQRGDQTYCVSTQPFGNLNELRARYQAMGGVTVNQLNMAFGRFVFDVDVDTPEADPNSQPVPTEWHVTMPGAIESHNADRVDGQTLVWALGAGEKTAMHAESTGPFGFGAPLVIGAAILAFLLVAGIAGGTTMYLARRPRRAP